MYNSVAKKIFAVGSAAAIALSALAPFAAQAAAHAAGTNVKSSDGTVWMIMPDGTRRAYTSGGAFLSFGFNSFANVVDANADDLALSAGAFIPPQDGQIMCSDRGADKGTCYFITGSQKAGFTSAAVFTGRGFSFSRALYGDVSFLGTTSNIEDTTTPNRPGSLVNNNGTVYLVGSTGLLGIPDVATFNSWGYSFADVVPANAADKAMTMTGVMAARTPGQLNPTALSSDPNQPPVVSGSVSASLAANTPAAQTIAVNGIAAASSTVVTMANFTFTGNGTVTSLGVKRIGVSPDSILTNVYLYDGGTRLTDAASIGGSSSVVFNNPAGLFTVSGSKTISVVVEVAGNAGAGQTVGIQLISFAVANGTPAVVAISGNTFTTSTASDLAFATFAGVTPSGSSFDPAVDTEVFRSNVTISQRDMTMSRLIVRNIGSSQAADIVNLRLRVDGTQVAQVQNLDANGYAYFSFSPVTLKSGTRIITILADVVGGSSRNFQFQIRNKADVNFTDTQYNTSVSPANTFPVGSASSNSISSGSLTIVRASDSPSGNVTNGSSDVSLAKYTVTAYGEAMKIETLTLAATSSNLSVGALRNGRVLINGVQYGSTATLSSTTNSTYTAGGTEYTLNYTVMPGSPVTVEVRADMHDNSGTNDFANNDTVTVYMVAVSGDNNVQRLTSLGYFSAPSASIAGNSITNTTGTATLSKNNTYANQSAPLPQTGYKLGSFNLVGSSSEDININSVIVNFVNSSTTLANINDVSVRIAGNVFGSIKAAVATTSSSTFSGNYSLPKNTTVSVDVYGTMPSSATPTGSDTFNVMVYVNGTTASSATTVGTGAAGQTISASTASITAAQDPSTPVAAITAGNQTKAVAAFKFTTTNDQHTVSEIVLSIPNNTTVQSVILKDGGTTLATLPGGASSTFSNLNLVIPANSTKILTVELTLVTVGIGAGTSGENVKVNLHSYKSAPSSTGSISTTTHGINVAGNNLYVYKAIPTITNVALPTGTLVNGTNTLSKFTVSSGGTGTIGWHRFVFTYASSTGVTLASPTLWDADTNTQIVGTAVILGSASTITFYTDTEQQISGAKTYVLKATVGGAATDDYLNTSIAQPSSFVAPATAVSASSTAASFIWSDVSAQSHSFTTADWNNDFLVKNLPTDSQALAY